jgi:hypothetical protein
MAIKINGTTVIDDSRNLTNIAGATFTGTGAITLPTGTTDQRPASTAGMIRFNSTLAQVEYYNGTSYNGLAGTSVDYTTFYLANQ